MSNIVRLQTPIEKKNELVLLGLPDFENKIPFTLNTTLNTAVVESWSPGSAWKATVTKEAAPEDGWICANAYTNVSTSRGIQITIVNAEETKVVSIITQMWYQDIGGQWFPIPKGYKVGIFNYNISPFASSNAKPWVTFYPFVKS